MVDVAKLSFEADTRDLIKADKSLEALEKQSKRTENATDQLSKSFDNMGAASARSSASSNKMGSSLRGSFSPRTQSQIQNASFQLQDIAVQLEMGTDASRVMAQQLPQLLGGFGALGAVLGVVAGVGIPLAAMFLDNGEAAGKSKEDIEDYKDALEGLKSVSKDLAVEQAKLAGTFSDMRIFDAERQLRELQTVYQELSKSGSGGPGLFSVLFGVKSDREEAFEQITKITSALAKAREEQAKLKEIEALKELKEDARDIFEELSPLTKITREYREDLNLLNEAYAKGQINATNYKSALSLLKQRYNEQIDPLNASIEALREEREILKLSEDDRHIEAQLRKEVDDIRRSGQVIKENDIALLREEIRLNDQLKKINQEKKAKEKDPLQKAFEGLQGQTTGQLQNIGYQLQALNMAFQMGMVSAEGYTTRLVDLNMQAAQLRMSLGDGTFADAALNSFGPILEGYEGVLSGISDSFGETFNTVADGLANSIGRAIVYSDNLGESLRDVARSAVSELISSLVKIGIQYAINAAIGQSLAAATAATTAATAGALSAAWAPAAALASLATLGANSAPAIAGIGATLGAAQALSAVSQATSSIGANVINTPVATLANGGYVSGPGGPRSDSIPARLSNGEFVINAAATRKNRPMLEAINSGKSMSSGVNISIQNYAGVDMEVQQLSENDVVVIARRTAKQVVREDAPQVISADLTNPNSRTSKAISNNTNAQRKR